MDIEKWNPNKNNFNIMKPLKKILDLIKLSKFPNDSSKKETTLFEYRELLLSILRSNSETIVRLKDGTLLKLTLISDDKLVFDDIDLYFEFNDKKEIQDWVESENESFLENVVRYHKLKNILDDSGENELI